MPGTRRGRHLRFEPWRPALDYGPSTLEVLPEIVDAVRGRVPILFDSGIRRGSDILKALALGASAVALGRAPLWGLAAYGSAGVQKVLEILQAELVQAMAANGRTTLASIDRSLGEDGVPMSSGQALIGEPPGRIAPARELVEHVRV